MRDVGLTDFGEPFKRLFNQGVIRYQHVGDIRTEEIPFMLEQLREAGA